MDKITWFKDYQAANHASKLENCIITEEMIEFYTTVESYRYKVELLRDIDFKYKGNYKIYDSDVTGKVNCELYQNGKNLMLLGIWYEESDWQWVATKEKRHE